MEYNLLELNSVKMWILINAYYESGNLESLNAKVFDQELAARPTIIGYHPLSEAAMADPLTKLHRSIALFY